VDSSRCRLNLFLVALCGVLAWAVPLAHAQQNEVAKLLAEDGTADAWFGHSIAIDSGTIAVGAARDNANGFRSGAAYLFDAVTGAQILKLLPNDGVEFDEFGFSIAMDDGVVAVGARHDDGGNGTRHGSVYLFNASTGVQINKISPSDGDWMDEFGYSIAIDNGIVAVGARQEDDNGTESGSAYLFSVTTGAQIAKLLPTDDSWVLYFGASIDIDNGIVAVGANETDNINSAVSGSAYLFDASTGVQIVKLLPDREEVGFFGGAIAIDNGIVAVGTALNYLFAGGHAAFLFDASNGTQISELIPSGPPSGFGFSVAIDNGVVAVGGARNCNNDQCLGAAYLFDVTTGAQLLSLLPSEGENQEQFGYSIAIDNDIVAVGAREDDDNGDGSGSAYIFDVGLDTDGDGLLDDWELNGIPYTGGDGVTRRFMLPGADPNYKDLYVEVDAMSGLSLSSTSISMLETAFNFAPVSNPDGFDGINLHILTDDTNLPHVAVWQTDGCWPLDFDSWRLSWYGTGVERSDPEFPSLLEAKAKAYRYCIVADTAGPDKVGGCAPIPGDNLVIYIGASHLNDSDHAAAFMHELGHNLGLDHGGGDGLNGKPNYPSIMNYVLAYDTPWNHAFWQMDYSREGIVSFLSLNESALDENIGVGTPASYYANYAMPFGVNALDGSGNTVRKIMYVSLDGWKTDFGDTAGTGFQDGSYDTGVVQDLNYAVDVPAGLIFPSEPSPGDTLVPYNDWANISLKLAAAIGPGAPAPVYPTDELTEEAVLWIADNFPTPPVLCPADVNRDGNLDFFDLQVYLNWYAAGDLQADLIADGILDFFDVQEFLNLYAAGCP
jgi:FG-GAP repeat protein